MQENQVIGSKCHQVLNQYSTPCKYHNSACPMDKVTGSGKSYEIRQIRHDTYNQSEHVRITAPSSLGNPLIAPLVNEFMERYTTLNVELLLDDQVVDMVKEGIDVSIHVGWLDDSNFVARKLGDMPRLLSASPGYIEQRGKPESPAELVDHNYIIFTRLPTPHHWIFTKNKREERVKVKGRLKTENADAVRTALLGGMGVGTVSSFLIGGDIKAGRLEHLLSDYDCGSAGIYAVYQNRHYQQAKVRLFIDFIAT